MSLDGSLALSDRPKQILFMIVFLFLCVDPRIMDV